MRDKIRDLVIEAIVDSSKLTEIIEKLYVLFDDWERIDTLPKIDGFYLVYSIEKNIWTKALFKMGEFHTIESDIDGYITHWKSFIKPLSF